MGLLLPRFQQIFTRIISTRYISSIITKKANLKTEITKKQSTSIFPKKQTFLIPWYAHEMVKHTQTNRWQQPTNYLNEFNHFVSVSGGVKCSFFGKLGVLCFVVNSILRFALLPYYGRYNLFIRNQVDYADVIYGQTYNSFFHEKIESIQCKFDNNRCDKKGTLFEKLYQELRLGSLKSRR